MESSGSSSGRRLARIGVFCGASIGKDRAFIDAANKLGTTLAARKIHLVYGGGSMGLMGGVALSALVGGSRALGIIPRTLEKSGLVGHTLGDELLVSSMHERMNNMLSNADAFIILPGGYGTLEEMFQVLSWAQLNIHHKPIGLLNVKGFFDALLAFLDICVEQEFISPASRKLLVTASTPNQLIDKLQVFETKVDPRVASLDWSNKTSVKKHRVELDLNLTL